MGRAYTGRVSFAGRSPLRLSPAGGSFSRFCTLAAALLVLLLATAPASANLQYILNSPADYGTVTLTQMGPNTVQVTVTLIESPDVFFVETGGHQTFDFNLGSTSATITNLTSGFTVSPGTSFTQAGFGTFDYSISCKGTPPACGSGASPPNADVQLVFDVNLTGITPASFIANSSGWFFSADLCVPNMSPCTFPVGSNRLPEPMTLLVFAAGLVGAVGFARRRNRSKSV